MSSGMRVHGRRRFSRRRQPEGQQRPRDRRDEKADWGARAGERAPEKLSGLLEPRPCVGCRSPKGRGGESGPVKEACETLGASKPGRCEFPRGGKPDAQTGREASGRFVEDGFGRHRGRRGHRGTNRGLRRAGSASARGGFRTRWENRGSGPREPREAVAGPRRSREATLAPT